MMKIRKVLEKYWKISKKKHKIVEGNCKCDECQYWDKEVEVMAEAEMFRRAYEDGENIEQYL